MEGNDEPKVAAELQNFRELQENRKSTRKT